MTAEEFKIRTRAFRNHTAIAALVLLFSFIAVLAFFILMADKVSEVFVIGGLPGVFVLMIVALAYSRRLARKMGLVCPHCGFPSSATLRSAVLTEGRCRKCGKRMYDDVV
jgi:ribosomal protein L37E